ncbi:MAG: hypothetical protein NTY80_05135 [candidate division SR1 bacterium]|nr:hypothetical protein [candidate division SR1 bacterium]
MHLIPSWILIIIMILSWRKYPLVGAIAFTAFGLWYATINIANFFLALRAGEVAPYHYLTWPMIITVPSLGIGLMFFLCRRVKKNPAYNIFYKNK